jgi:hypothetical protein
MVEAEFLFKLLVRLFADPACFDGRGEGFQRGAAGQIREIVFALTTRAPLPDQSVLAGHVLAAHVSNTLRLSVGDPHAHCSETAGNRKDQRHVVRVDLLMTRNTDSPLQPALTERLPERRTQTVAGIGQHAPEPYAGGFDPVDLVDCNLRLAPERSAGIRARFIRAGSFVLLSGRNDPRPTINDCPSSAAPRRRSPAPHRRHRQAGSPERAIPPPAVPNPKRRLPLSDVALRDRSPGNVERAHPSTRLLVQAIQGSGLMT